jgi:DNA-binding NarL/FixJ family response regulator
MTIAKSRSETKTLLWIDDCPKMLNVLVEIVEPEFKIIGTLVSARFAIEKAKELQPDIILLDIDLGDMNGFSVAEQLRDSGCRAKIVFLSAHENVEFTKAAQALGADGYVFKSQIVRKLLTTLRKVVS